MEPHRKKKRKTTKRRKQQRCCPKLRGRSLKTPLPGHDGKKNGRQALCSRRQSKAARRATRRLGARGNHYSSYDAHRWMGRGSRHIPQVHVYGARMSPSRVRKHGSTEVDQSVIRVRTRLSAATARHWLWPGRGGSLLYSARVAGAEREGSQIAMPRSARPRGTRGVYRWSVA